MIIGEAGQGPGPENRKGSVTSTPRPFRRVLAALEAGARIWRPAQARVAYICHRNHPGKNYGPVSLVRRSTLEAMIEAGCLDSESKGEQFSDTHYLLPVLVKVPGQREVPR